MSKLTGHWKISSQAVLELKKSGQAGAPLNTMALSRLYSQDLATAVIVRDLTDVLNGGHWGDYGQSHHFMRKFNGQSQFEAYQDGVNWIQKNALLASKKLYKVIIASKEAAEKKERPEPAFWVSELGFACHAMQDSFADGHARREMATSNNAPGRITRVLKYAGTDMDGHSEYDKHWKNSTDEIGKFSLKGRLAINATKEIISMVILTAIQHVKKGTSPVSLSGWSAFKCKWLVASPLLSKKRDVVVDMINEYQTFGIQHGNRNILTISMDEAGLAKAIFKSFGTNTVMVHKVFTRLDNKLNSDADDVVMHYISEVKRSGGGIQLLAIKKDSKLLMLFKSILNSGWTTTTEKNALTYLTGI